MKGQVDKQYLDVKRHGVGNELANDVLEVGGGDLAGDDVQHLFADLTDLEEGSDEALEKYETISSKLNDATKLLTQRLPALRIGASNNETSKELCRLNEGIVC